jgi:hypothetical protein
MAFHLAARTDDLVAQGMDRDAARRDARRRLATIAQRGGTPVVAGNVPVSGTPMAPTGM